MTLLKAKFIELLYFPNVAPDYSRRANSVKLLSDSLFLACSPAIVPDVNEYRRSFFCDIGRIAMRHGAVYIVDYCGLAKSTAETHPSP